METVINLILDKEIEQFRQRNMIKKTQETLSPPTPVTEKSSKILLAYSIKPNALLEKQYKWIKHPTTDKIDKTPNTVSASGHLL